MEFNEINKEDEDRELLKDVDEMNTYYKNKGIEMFRCRICGNEWEKKEILKKNGVLICVECWIKITG